MYRRLSLAISLAALPAVSFAAPEMYGSARISGVYLDQSSLFPGESVDDLQVASADTRIGWRGDEMLRDNLRAIYQIEAGLNLDTDNSDIDLREGFVGIGGGWGQGVAGRLSSPFENMLSQDGWGFNNQRRSFDPFEDTIGDNGALLGNDWFHLRYDNSIRYQSPELGNFDLGIQYVTDADQTTEVEDNDNAVYSVGVTWGIDSIWASLGYEQVNSAFAFDPEPMGIRFGVGGSISDKFSLGALYETIDGDDDPVLDRDGYTAFATFRFGEDNGREFRFAYTLSEDIELIEDSGAELWSAGYFCLPTPDLEFHAVISGLTNDDNAVRLGPNGFEPYGLGVGAESGTSLPGIAGEDQMALELGLRYNF